MDQNCKILQNKTKKKYCKKLVFIVILNKILAEIIVPIYNYKKVQIRELA